MNRIKQLILLAIFHQATPTNIKFFEGKNSTGYFSEIINLRPTCTNVPSLARIEDGSIETDTCLIAFNLRDCDESGMSAKILPGSHKIDDELLNMPWGTDQKGRSTSIGIRSYFPCNDKEGGPQLNVEIQFEEDKAEFKNVCGCRDLKMSMKDVRDGLVAYNHGNSFMKYTKSKCKGEGVVVPAGKSIFSKNLNAFFHTTGKLAGKVDKKNVIKSIGPVINSLYYQNNCIQLKINIHKFEFEEDPINNTNIYSFENMDSIKSHTRNNSTGKIVEEFNAKLEIIESVDVDFGETLSNIHSIGVDTSVEVETKAGLKFLGEGNIKAGLTASYLSQSANEKTKNTKSSTKNKKLWQVKKQVEVLPCSDVTVNGMLKMVKNKVLKYKIYGRVTGQFSNGKKIKMTAEMIRKNLGKDLQVLKDLDRYTVEVVGNGAAQSNFGIDARTYVQSEKIEGCKVKQ